MGIGVSQRSAHSPDEETGFDAVKFGVELQTELQTNGATLDVTSRHESVLGRAGPDTMRPSLTLAGTRPNERQASPKPPVGGFGSRASRWGATELAPPD